MPSSPYDATLDKTEHETWLCLPPSRVVFIPLEAFAL